VVLSTFSPLPLQVTFTVHPYNNLRKKFPPTFLTESGFNLMNRFLTYDPKKRISAIEALEHKYFKVCWGESMVG
jgi:cell division cycle 2-like protein